MNYRDIGEISRAEIEMAIAGNDVEALKVAVLSVALYATDRAWTESICQQLACHKDPHVRGNAILGFGHLARLHRRLDLDTIKPLIVAALYDPDPYVRGQAEAAADDIRHFLEEQSDR